MKRFVAVSLLVVLLGFGSMAASKMSKVGLLSLFVSEEQQVLLELCSDFLEAIKFKDFSAAADFHNELDRAKADIPKLIERLFKIKPEFLNIRDLRVLSAEIDSTGNRAITRFNSNVEILNSLKQGRRAEEGRKQRDVEGVLYWRKEDGRWVLKLESSLKDMDLKQTKLKD
jgi:hypothetical protein